MSKVPIFQSLTAEQIDIVIELTTYSKHKKDDVLCIQGDPADLFYIIVSGTCSVHVGDNRQRVGSLREFEYFGESILVANGTPTRNATVIVESEQLQVLSLSSVDLENLMAMGILTSEMITQVELAARTRLELSNSITSRSGGSGGNGERKITEAEEEELKGKILPG